MGGDQNIDELNTYLHTIKQAGLKTCIYSGNDSIEKLSLELLDYIKVGHYDLRYGGLNNPNTNQRFYINNNGLLVNATIMFQN